MKLSDMMAKAYDSEKQNSNSNETEQNVFTSSDLAGKKIKAFVPETIKSFSKNEGQDALNNKKIKSFNPPKLSSQELVSENLKEVKISEFVPKKISEEKFVKNVESNVLIENRKEKAKKSASQQLENAARYLKTGGLLKVPVHGKNPDGTDSVYRRVAKFLLLIGEEEAAKILPHLEDKQIERIIPEIASIRTVSKEEADAILNEFKSLLEQEKTSGGIATAREILEKAYGKNKAERFLERSIPVNETKAFEYLNDQDSEKIYMLLKDENPGVQSLVLSSIKADKSAKVINLMKPDEKKEIVMRLAKMEPVSPEIIRRVDQGMKEKSDNFTLEKAENIDGRNALAQILKKMDIGSEQDILNTLTQEDPDLGEDLRVRLFTIDDVINADDRFVQEKLRLYEEREIVYLIAGKPDDFREKILSNISAGRRAEVYAQEDILKPLRKSDCDKITTEFFSYLRHAFDAGNLIIKNRNDQEFV